MTCSSRAGPTPATSTSSCSTSATSRRRPLGGRRWPRTRPRRRSRSTWTAGPPRSTCPPGPKPSWPQRFGLGPDAPFACTGGVCGTCRARLVSGEVRMDRNYALEPEELARGLVLACQSHPVSDRGRARLRRLTGTTRGLVAAPDVAAVGPAQGDPVQAAGWCHHGDRPVARVEPDGVRRAAVPARGRPAEPSRPSPAALAASRKPAVRASASRARVGHPLRSRSASPRRAAAAARCPVAWSSTWAGRVPGRPPAPVAAAMPVADWTMLSNPRRPAQGPRCPQAESPTVTRCGCRASSPASSRPSRASAPGR